MQRPLPLRPHLDSTSLAILLPGSRYRKRYIAGDLRAAAELEEFARHCTELMNRRSFNELEQYCPVLPGSEHYQARYEGFPKVQSLTDHVKIFRQVASQYPKLHVEIVEVSAFADDEAGEGICYVVNEISGEVPGVTKQGVSVTEWQREDGSWKLTKMYSMRGITQPGDTLQ